MIIANLPFFNVFIVGGAPINSSPNTTQSSAAVTYCIPAAPNFTYASEGWKAELTRLLRESNPDSLA